MNKLRFATLWFDGCSGCHMSILDMDERLLDLAAVLEVVYSPLVDAKQFPKNVDVTCVEGAISSPEDEALLHLVRQRTRLLIALGDCAVTGNVPAMRNVVGAPFILQSIYVERLSLQPQVPTTDLPRLNDKALPLHQFVAVDLFIPGCPPSADTLYTTLKAVSDRKPPEFTLPPRFGA
jgi:NAD-reducing hydrogenase small subunit